MHLIRGKLIGLRAVTTDISLYLDVDKGLSVLQREDSFFPETPTSQVESHEVFCNVKVVVTVRVPEPEPVNHGSAVI
jgi:hypothetical protein